ncbi:hypothetical protein L6452_26924 [Arctium lappa]|uniref:Uncharacterized protein n=2 Tax=Arctium lappa TaxID=4217 RepID=A0ACB8ZVB8_ARCLA|nr:hypothetical protein L6452_26923 [Arctium lappa]KAI3701676.1 hypothetical protein L6452_26924 [Arctium lappa]
MGACYSTVGDGRRDRKAGSGGEDDDDGESGRWWKSKSGRKMNRYKLTDLRFKFGGDRRSTVEDDDIYHVSSRISGNGSSSIASLHTQQGKKGTNQDAMIVWEAGGFPADLTIGKRPPGKKFRQNFGQI